ncbi:hypothetical protein Tco_0125095, partial [Tanacetum coccineum]
MDTVQKARIKWDMEGDENTKFFHGLVKKKRRSQSVQGILHQGNWISKPHQVKQVFLNFYKEKFQANESMVSFSPVAVSLILNSEDRLQLEGVVSMHEIKAAIWDCGSDKAPGPDGF